MKSMLQFLYLWSGQVKKFVTDSYSDFVHSAIENGNKIFYLNERGVQSLMILHKMVSMVFTNLCAHVWMKWTDATHAINIH